MHLYLTAEKKVYIMVEKQSFEILAEEKEKEPIASNEAWGCGGDGQDMDHGWARLVPSIVCYIVGETIVDVKKEHKCTGTLNIMKTFRRLQGNTCILIINMKGCACMCGVLDK